MLRTVCSRFNFDGILDCAKAEGDIMVKQLTCTRDMNLEFRCILVYCPLKPWGSGCQPCLWMPCITVDCEKRIMTKADTLNTEMKKYEENAWYNPCFYFFVPFYKQCAVYRIINQLRRDKSSQPQQTLIAKVMGANIFPRQ